MALIDKCINFYFNYKKQCEVFLLQNSNNNYFCIIKWWGIVSVTGEEVKSREGIKIKNCEKYVYMCIEYFYVNIGFYNLKNLNPII